LTLIIRSLWKKKSFPKRKNGKTGENERVLYPPSNAPAYPTAEQIRNALKKARLTDTELMVEHVEMLLNVLVLDGKIERVSFVFVL
jgi:DNA-directed RNA polymerase III subunit RPC6